MSCDTLAGLVARTAALEATFARLGFLEGAAVPVSSAPAAHIAGITASVPTVAATTASATPATVPVPATAADESAAEGGDGESSSAPVIQLPDSSHVTVVTVDHAALPLYSHGAYMPQLPAEAGSSANETRQLALAAETPLGAVSVFYRCPSDYYDWLLEARRARLNAPSIHYLCKSLVMENTKWPVTAENTTNPTHADSRFYFIIVQYTARLHNERVGKAIRELSGKPRKLYNFRLCSPEANVALTGYTHNGVTPLGCSQKIPIIISHKIVTELKQGFFWLGGGEVDLKWRVPVKEFLEHFEPMVANITYDLLKEDGPEF